MTERDFWQIMEQRRTWKLLDPTRTHFCSGPGTEDVFIQNLATFSVDELLSFATYWNHHWSRTVRDDLWAAAYLIDGGCSDDAFYNYVRPGVILLGENLFEAVIKDPDQTLAGLPNAGQELIQGEFCHVVQLAFEEKTGQDLDWGELPQIRPINDPPDRAVNWKEEDLPRLFPKLWAIYGDSTS